MGLGWQVSHSLLPRLLTAHHWWDAATFSPLDWPSSGALTLCVSADPNDERSSLPTVPIKVGWGSTDRGCFSLSAILVAVPEYEEYEAFKRTDFGQDGDGLVDISAIMSS